MTETEIRNAIQELAPHVMTVATGEIATEGDLTGIGVQAHLALPRLTKDHIAGRRSLSADDRGQGLEIVVIGRVRLIKSETMVDDYRKHGAGIILGGIRHLGLEVLHLEGMTMKIA